MPNFATLFRMNVVRTILAKQSQIVPTLTLILLFWVTSGTGFHVVDSYGNAVTQEQSIPTGDTDQAPETILSSFQEAVIPISKIHILFFYHFLREWILVEEDTFTVSADTPPTPNRFFLTLFRRIISPNAP